MHLLLWFSANQLSIVTMEYRVFLTAQWTLLTFDKTELKHTTYVFGVKLKPRNPKEKDYKPVLGQVQTHERVCIW